MKAWFKSKTMWANFSILMVGVLVTMIESAPLEPQTAGMVLGGLGAINMFLRSITTTALGSPTE
jgi:hypothetical protein